MSGLVRRYERDRRSPNVSGGSALLRVDRHALCAVDRFLRRSRQLGFAADDATVFGATAAVPTVATLAAATGGHTGVMQLVLVVERLQREASVSLFAAAAPLGDVRVILAHRLRLVDLQLRVQPLQLALIYTNQQQDQ